MSDLKVAEVQIVLSNDKVYNYKISLGDKILLFQVDASPYSLLILLDAVGIEGVFDDQKA